MSAKANDVTPPKKEREIERCILPSLSPSVGLAFTDKLICKGFRGWQLGLLCIQNATRDTMKKEDEERRRRGEEDVRG